MEATCNLVVSAWDEHPYLGWDGPKKLSKVSALFALEGDLVGTLQTQYLMTYTVVGQSPLPKGRGLGGDEQA